MISYPRGFLYCRTPSVHIPDAWKKSDLFNSLWYDSSWHRSTALFRGASVEVLGTCVPVDEEVGPAYEPAMDLARHLHRSEEAFFNRLSVLCGRHLIVFRRYLQGDNSSTAGTKILTDACGMRTAFYSSGLQPIVSSHPKLVHDSANLSEDLHRIPAKWGYPGNTTPWPNVNLLTPNTLICLDTGIVKRFFRKESSKNLHVEDAAERISRMLKNALVNFSCKYGRFRLGLTAGIDSRTILAVATSAKIEFDSYTYITHNRRRATERDALAASELAKAVGIPHFTLKAESVPIAIEAAAKYRNASYYSHTRSVIETIRNRKDSWPTFVTANTAEIGRAFYFSKNLPIPSTAEHAGDLYLALARRKIQTEIIKRYGEEKYKEVVVAGFRRFYETTDFKAACHSLHPFDALYWEHRMSAWYAVTNLERDFAFDTFPPLNARIIFESMLDVDLESRKRSKVFKRIVELNMPELAKLPINPAAWPRLSNAMVQ